MEDEQTPLVEKVLPDEQPENLLNQLAAKRQIVAETKETLIPIQGYSETPPALMVKYRLLDGPEIARIATNTRQEFKNKWDRNVHAMVDVLIAACVGIYVDNDDGKEPAPLTVSGQPLAGFSRGLAEGLQFADKIDDPDRPRDVVFGLFGNNDIALATHANNLNRWMSDTSVDVTREMFEGNL